MQDWVEFEKVEPFGFPFQNLSQAAIRQAIYGTSFEKQPDIDTLMFEFRPKPKVQAKVKGLTAAQWRLILVPPKEGNL